MNGVSNHAQLIWFDTVSTNDIATAEPPNKIMTMQVEIDNMEHVSTSYNVPTLLDIYTLYESVLSCMD